MPPGLRVLVPGAPDVRSPLREGQGVRPVALLLEGRVWEESLLRFRLTDP